MTDHRRSDVVPLIPALLRYATSLVRDVAAAEDLVHDALVAALAKLDTHDPERPVKPWLLGIVRHRFLDDRRRDAVRTRHLGLLKIDAASAEPVRADEGEIAAIRQSLDQLPPDQRETLFLVAAEGLTYQEAADTLGVPIGTIMSRLSRARARLRRMDDEADRPRLRVVDFGE